MMRQAVYGLLLIMLVLQATAGATFAAESTPLGPESEGQETCEVDPCPPPLVECVIDVECMGIPPLCVDPGCLNWDCLDNVQDCATPPDCFSTPADCLPPPTCISNPVDCLPPPTCILNPADCIPGEACPWDVSECLSNDCLDGTTKCGHPCLETTTYCYYNYLLECLDSPAPQCAPVPSCLLTVPPQNCHIEPPVTGPGPLCPVSCYTSEPQDCGPTMYYNETEQKCESYGSDWQVKMDKQSDTDEICKKLVFNDIATGDALCGNAWVHQAVVDRHACPGWQDPEKYEEDCFLVSGGGSGRAYLSRLSVYAFLTNEKTLHPHESSECDVPANEAGWIACGASYEHAVFHHPERDPAGCHFGRALVEAHGGMVAWNNRGEVGPVAKVCYEYIPPT